MKALKIIGYILLGIILLVAVTGTYVKVALPNMGEAPKLAIDRTPARVERGKYLATNVAVCMDCHSTRDWSSYAGPMTGGLGAGGEKFDQQMGFPGTFYAPNITPYKLGDWSDGEIYRAITTGENKFGRAIFPLMPWEHVGRMDTEDVYSIIAYLRTLPAVKKDVPKSEPDFPVNFIINTMPHQASPQKIPSEKDTINYGGYLVNAAGCVDCHSKVDHGSKIPGTEFGGGMEFKQPGGVVHSANITADPATGIGAWSKAAFIARFKVYDGKAKEAVKLGKGDLITPMPWYMYSGMKESDLGAIYAYLRTIRPIKNSVQKFQKF